MSTHMSALSIQDKKFNHVWYLLIAQMGFQRLLVSITMSTFAARVRLLGRMNLLVSSKKCHCGSWITTQGTRVHVIIFCMPWWQSVQNTFTGTFLAFIRSIGSFCNLLSSIALELMTAVTSTVSSSTILSVDIWQYIQNLALKLGLSHRPSPLQFTPSACSSVNNDPCSLPQVSCTVGNT